MELSTLSCTARTWAHVTSRTRIRALISDTCACVVHRCNYAFRLDCLAIMCITTLTRCFIPLTILTVLSSLIGSAEGSCTQPVFQAPPAHCPGERAVFTCKVDDSSTDHHTVWEVSEAIAPYGGCPLLHDLWPHMTIECGSFHGRATEESPSQCFISEFSATAATSLNGTSVTCFYVRNGYIETRGSGVLQVIGISFRGVAGTTKLGGQTPRKLQAPVFLVLFINHKTHLTSPQSRSTQHSFSVTFELLCDVGTCVLSRDSVGHAI